MRKFLLLGLFVSLAYVANLYFSTGSLPFLPQPKLTKEEKVVSALKERFLDVRHRYASLDPENEFLPFDDFPSPDWAMAESVKIKLELNQVRDEISSEYAMAEIGWLSMEVRKFMKQIEADQAH